MAKRVTGNHSPSRHMAKRKKVQAVESDFGPRHATQESHGPVTIDYVAQDGIENRNRVRRNVTAPLEYYRGKKFITPDQFIAGSALRTLYVQANAEAALTPQYAERIGQGSVQAAYVSKRMIMQKYNQALWHISPLYAQAVRVVCCSEDYVNSKADRIKLARGLSQLMKWFQDGSKGRPKKVFVRA